MRWTSRNRWGLAAVALGLAGVVLAAAVTQAPDGGVEQLLRGLAADVSALPGEAEAVRRARIEGAVSRALTPDARLQVDELPDLSRPSPALVAALAGLVAPGEQATVELTHVQVHEEGEGRARAVVDVRLAGDPGRDLHAPHRRLALDLVQVDGTWRITSVAVPAETQAEPEPRP